MPQLGLRIPFATERFEAALAFAADPEAFEADSETFQVDWEAFEEDYVVLRQ